MPIIVRKPSQLLIDLVGTLGGTWNGNIAMCRCPAHVDRKPSLSLRQGDTGLLVTCFAGCDAIDVLRELDRVSITGRYDAPAASVKSGTANIERLWGDARPVPGTLGEIYLGLRVLLPVPNDIRFHPQCPLGPKPFTVFKPALLVAVREMRRLVALQRIFLDPSTGCHTEKATLGPLGSGAWQGGGQGPVIGLAEGFETARAWTRIHGLPCWATLGSRRLDLITIPDSVTTLILAGDGDIPGRAAVDRAVTRYARPNRTIRLAFPVGYKDWADVLEAQERRGGEG